jgi:hypothetical protein
MLDDLFQVLQQVARDYPDRLKQVDADAGEKVEMWGKQGIRVVFPDGRVLWIQEVK